MAQTTLAGLGTNLPQVGAAADYCGPLYNLKKPVLADFTQLNGGTATQVGGTIYVEAPQSNSFDLRSWVKTVPSAPYTVTMGLLAILPRYDAFNCGIVMRQNSDGKLVTCNIRGGANGQSGVEYLKWTNVTTLSGLSAGVNFRRACPAFFLQLSDDTSNRIFRYSADGVTFQQLTSVANNDFLTPNTIGFYVNAGAPTSTVGMQMTIIHWDGA